MHKTCKIMQTFLCHILFNQIINSPISFLMTCTTHMYLMALDYYLCTFPRTIKTGIGTCCGSSIHSFHSILEFLIWHSTFGAITFYQFWFLIFFKVFLSFSPYPRNHFKINLKKILSFVTFFCLTEK